MTENRLKELESSESAEPITSDEIEELIGAYRDLRKIWNDMKAWYFEEDE